MLLTQNIADAKMQSESSVRQGPASQTPALSPACLPSTASWTAEERAPEEDGQQSYGMVSGFRRFPAAAV